MRLDFNPARGVLVSDSPPFFHAIYYSETSEVRFKEET